VPNVLVKKLYRPIGPTALAAYIARAVELELEPPTADEIKEALSITIAFKSITRRESIKRAHERDAVVEWATEITGIKKEDIELSTLEFKYSSEILMRFQSVDILACIVWDACAGIEFGHPAPGWFGDPDDLWVASTDPEHWGDAEDWLVEQCLTLAWEANPQLAIGAGQVPLA
jgi:hypothetical protein